MSCKPSRVAWLRQRLGCSFTRTWQPCPPAMANGQFRPGAASPGRTRQRLLSGVDRSMRMLILGFLRAPPTPRNAFPIFFSPGPDPKKLKGSAGCQRTLARMEERAGPSSRLDVRTSCLYGVCCRGFAEEHPSARRSFRQTNGRCPSRLRRARWVLSPYAREG